jgi:glycosyltransferase involved in cell wall biosynthesis
MEKNIKNLIVVLGMHRSGTSSITRGLQVLGASFGENLLPPVKGDNDKGYFEDVEINALNIQALHALNSEWFYVSPIDEKSVIQLNNQGFMLRAVKLLRNKIKDCDILAIKDPRISILLPFWGPVIDHLGLNTSYVIALRHPLSVVKSLAKRHGFTPTRSYLLWLGHVLESLHGTSGKQRLVVNYDRLLQMPDEELSRIAKTCNLKINDAELIEYKKSFLEIELRHTFYKVNDLNLDGECPPLVQEVFKNLADVSAGHTNLEDPEFAQRLANWMLEFKRLKLIFNLIDQQQEQISTLNHVASEREAQVAQLSQTVQERAGQIRSLNQALADRESVISSLKQTAAEKDSHVVSLQQTVSKTSGQIDSFNQIINEKNGQIADMLAMMERDAEIVRLSKAVTEREAEIARLSHSVEALRNSKSWRYTALIRSLASLTQPSTRLARSVRHAALESGGYLNLTEKVFAVAKREGLSGVTNRIAHVVEQHAPVATESGQPAHRNDYKTWIKLYDTLDVQAVQNIQKEIASFTTKPKISVVMPVYNAPLNYLEEAIRSVQNQIYDHWELCIADDASTDKSIRPLLERYAKEDPRIKVIFRSENGHISAASNSALSLASGDFVALLDNDDLLPVHALYHVAKTIIKNPNVALIYSDEDKIDEKGQRLGPYFKTNWNPDLFYSHNMFSHLGVYKRSLIENIGGFQLGLEGSQDYDLALRCIEKVNTSQIIHLPYILYHWRVHPASTAMSSDAKPYAMIAGERAINQHFQRTGAKGLVKLIGHGYNPHYDMPATYPLVSIIIPTRNAHELVSQCINSIQKLSTYPTYEILLIDNGSDDPASLAEWDRMAKNGVRILRDDSPFNYSALNNMAVKKAKGEVLILLNNHTEVIEPRWLEIMVSHTVRPGIGPVGAKLLYPDDTIQHAGLILGLGSLAGAAGHAHYKFPHKSLGYCGRISLTSNFSAVTGACIAVRRDLYLKVGGLDEENLRIAFNDVDFCLKLGEQGYRCVYAPDAVLYHHESASRGAEDNPEKKARFKQETDWMRARWGSLIDNDPYYSPNLTLEHGDFSLAWPPRVSSTQP